MINELLCIEDRIARNENLNKLLDLLGRDHIVETLASYLEVAASAKANYEPKPSGGIVSLLKTMSDTDVQKSL